MYCNIPPAELPGLARLSATTSGLTTAIPMNPFPDIHGLDPFEPSVVQLYTGLVFEGPGIAKSIVKGLKKRLESEGFESISDVVGIEA